MKTNSLPTSSKMLTLAVASALFVSSCASTTLIQTVPDKAQLFVNEQPVGNSPYRMTDTKIIGSNTEIRIEKEGYETYYTEISRMEEPDPGPIVGGFLLCPIFWLWGAKYKAVHTYYLVPLNDPNNLGGEITDPSKYEKLKELKKIYDEGVINQDEFNAEKKKILDSK
jgi:hypothetical protein